MRGKNNNIRGKKTNANWKKLFETYATDKRFTSLIYKKLLQIEKKKQPIEKLARYEQRVHKEQKVYCP